MDHELSIVTRLITDVLMVALAASPFVAMLAAIIYFVRKAHFNKEPAKAPPPLPPQL